MAPVRTLVTGGRRAVEVLILAAGAFAISAVPFDAARGAEKPAPQATERELIPGAERMTAAERDAYRRRMESASTPEEKARIRAEFAKAAEQQAASAALTGDPKRGA